MGLAARSSRVPRFRFRILPLAALFLHHFRPRLSCFLSYPSLFVVSPFRLVLSPLYFPCLSLSLHSLCVLLASVALQVPNISPELP